MIERERARTLDNTHDDDLFTIDEVAGILSTSVWTLRRTAINAGTLRPSMYVGRSPRFRKRDLVQWINEQIRAKHFAHLPRPKRRKASA